MNVKTTFIRTTVLLAGALTLGLTARAAETDALPTMADNYIKIGGGLPAVSGSDAGFQRRAQYSKDGFGGVEDFNFTQDVTKDTNLVIDGRLLPGSANYLTEFKVSKNEVGSFSAGYKRFRTYYDGIGGFFPLNNAWMPLYQRERYVDRAKFFVDATVALPKAPVFTFKYTNELRNGIKDSTIWGDSDNTGIPIYSLSSLNPVTSTRKILPAYIQLGERQQTWQASVSHTYGNTTGSFTIIGTRINNLDSRSVDRYTGELKPYPAIPSNPPTLVNWTLANIPNKGFDVVGFKENAIDYIAKVETKLTDMITAYAELSYIHSTGDTKNSRLISDVYNTAIGPVTNVGGYYASQRPPYSYTSAGSFHTDTVTGVMGVRINTAQALSLDVGLRGEQYTVSNNATANYVSNLIVQATGAVTPVPIGGPNALRINEKPWTPAVDARYSGIQNVALYATWDYRTSKEDERTTYTAYSVNTSNGTLTGPINFDSDAIREHHQNITLGANWTPATFFTLRPEFFSKDHENRFDGYGTTAGSFYHLDYDIYGARLSAIVRPLPVVTLNTRYIVQRGKAAIADDVSVKANSNDSRRYQIAETVDWAPSKLFYLQANVNLVYEQIVTAYPYVSGLAQTVMRNADNNYWDGSVIAAFAVDKQTDATVQGTYYKANNYNPALAATQMPFGAGAREYTLTAGLKHKFSDKWVAEGKVGYADSHNATTGGNTDFHGPLLYVSATHAF